MTRSLRLTASRGAAAVLAGCWRPTPPPLPKIAERAPTLDLLQRTGAGALAFLRLSGTAKGDALYEQFRKHFLRGAVREHFLRAAASRLNDAGVGWMLLKGWSVGRLYPDPRLRPSGDLDILVRKADLLRAEQALEGFDRAAYPIDLLTRLRPHYERTPDELLDRSLTLHLGECPIRVPRSEDLLRHLCLHLWKHSAWRPVWLCDIGAALENRPPEFDWDLCLRGSQNSAEWVEAACRLASELLTADLRGTPFEAPQRHLPRWLTEAVLLNWHHEWPTPVWQCVRTRQPALLIQNLRLRYPDPIRAAFRSGGPFRPCPHPQRAGLFALEMSTSMLRRSRELLVRNASKASSRLPGPTA